MQTAGWEEFSLDDCVPRATIVPPLHVSVAIFALALVTSGCCQPKEKPDTLFLEREVGQQCPSRGAAESPLRDRYGSSFGSVDGEPMSTVVVAFERCCYEASYTLDQTSTSSRECLELEAGATDPTALPPCPTGADAVSALSEKIPKGHTTAQGTPSVAHVVVISGPELDLSRDAYVDCAYPGTKLDSTDVCGTSTASSSTACSS